VAASCDVSELVESRGRTWFAAEIFLLCCLVMLADGFDNQAINYAAPSIIAEFAILPALMTPVFNLSIAGAILGAICFGAMADRIGRRPATIAAIALFGAFTVLIPAAHDLAWLALLRCAASFGIGGGMPMAIALATDYQRHNRRALTVTLLFLGYTAGSSGGGLLAAELIPRFGWRSVFYLGGVGAIAITLALLIRLPESIRFLALKRARDPRLAVYARLLRPDVPVGEATMFTIEQTANSGVPLKNLFTDGRAAMTSCMWLSLGFAFATHFFLSQWLTTLLTPVTGFANAARTQALFQAGGAFSFIFGFLVDRRGIPALTLAMLAAFLPVAAIPVGAEWQVWFGMVLALLSGILVLGGDICLSALPCIIYPSAIRSTATGAAFGVGRIGAILGPLVAGLLVYLNVPLNTIFLISGLPVLVSGAACVALDRAASGKSVRPVAAGS
jgi:AAHS family 4-hydroxybenzoate transporter-like MFS transporter